MFRWAFVALFSCNALASTVQALGSSPTTTTLAADLRAKDELLLNAVHRGDRKLWSEMTTSDFLYIEDGEISTRRRFLESLEEDGYAPLIIRTYEAYQVGDTVRVLHLDDVPHRPLRDTSRAQLLFAETWQKIDGPWKLRLIDINRLRVDPPSIKLTQAQADRLTGEYRNGTQTYKIRREGTHLFAVRTGVPEVEWKAETPDVLFLPGENRSRKVFFYDSTGKISRFADRDQSSEVVWRKR